MLNAECYFKIFFVPFFLGIDGGGTKTRCLLGDQNSILARGSGGGCSILRSGEACVQESLAGAIHEACVQAGVSPRQIARTCAGVTGCTDDGVASLVQRLLLDTVGGAIEVIGDMEIALEGAFGGDPGVIVIAGTGSIVYGRNAKGEKARAGGYGRFVSDEGSGYWIGAQALHEVLRAHASGLDTALLSVLMSELGAATVNDLVVRVNDNPAPDFAPLFPAVQKAAAQGDRVASGVLRRAGDELAQLARIVIERLFGAEEVLVATHGGVFANSPQVSAAFQIALRECCPQTHCVARDVDPSLGALERARREFGVWHRRQK